MGRRRQRETMKLIEEFGGSYTLEPAEKWPRWLYGDDLQNLVFWLPVLCAVAMQFDFAESEEHQRRTGSAAVRAL